jgi:nucleoside-diphosphate-sugar epimerase
MSSLAAREPRISPYAASKRAAEEAVMSLGDGLRWTALRPPVVYGPGDRETLLFFRCIRNGFVVLPAPRQARLSFLHVSDLAAAVVAILERLDPGGGVIEIDDGRRGGYGWPELVALGAQSVGRRPVSVPLAVPVQVVAGGLAVTLAKLVGRTPTLTPGKLREARHPDWVCREDRVLADLGWWARIGVAEGFRETVAWYRAAGWL